MYELGGVNVRKKSFINPKWATWEVGAGAKKFMLEGWTAFAHKQKEKATQFKEWQ